MMADLLSIVAAVLSFVAFVLATWAFLRASDALEIANNVSQKFSKMARDEASKHQSINATETEKLRQLGNRVESLEGRVIYLENSSATARFEKPPRATSTASLELSQYGHEKHINDSSLGTRPAHQASYDPHSSLLISLLRDFNAAALQPTPDKLDGLITRYRLEDEPSGLWRMQLADGRVVIMPGRAMLVGWAREYRGEMAKPLRENHLSKWYDMSADDYLALEKLAVRRPTGINDRGVLRGI